MAVIGVTQFLQKKFDTFDFEDAWKASFGFPERNFRCIIYGKPGNGKTEFCIKFAKMLTRFTSVYFNSFEQGISKSLQDALVRNNMQEVAGKIMFGDMESYAQMVDRLKKARSPRIVFIDSRDYLNLTGQQFKELLQMFPSKSFIIVCWEANSKPKGEHAKAIEFMCDVKCHVREFKVYPRSRYGGNVPFDIWPERPKRNNVQGSLF